MSLLDSRRGFVIPEDFQIPGKQRAFTAGSGEAVDFVMGDQKLVGDAELRAAAVAALVGAELLDGQVSGLRPVGGGRERHCFVFDGSSGGFGLDSKAVFSTRTACVHEGIHELRWVAASLFGAGRRSVRW